MAELAVAGFLLSRIGDAQRHATSVKNRITKFRKNPELFQVLSDSVDRLGERIKDVENIVKEYPVHCRKISLWFQWHVSERLQHPGGREIDNGQVSFRSIWAWCKQPNGQQETQSKSSRASE